GLAVVSPAFDSIYSHFVKSEEEASDWGAWEAMGYIVAAVASVLGSMVVNSYGFQILFIIMFVASLAGAIMSLFLFKNNNYLLSSKL
ncbi:MAG: hypothetical protein AAB869_03840, partial [Patescibacteria group bacterium]